MAALVSIDARFWRMIRIPFQFDPLSGEGARRYGGRWNRTGSPALYLASDHSTAVAEFHQDYLIPGTLVAYQVRSNSIADLTDGRGAASDPDVRKAIDAEWLRIARIAGKTPPSWSLADRLIAQGADGALVPSVQNRGGTNLVLWRWRDGAGEGAAVRVIDPDSELTRRG